MKKWILKIFAGIVFLTGLGNLAMSQVHILASTKVFASYIGIYLFMFIIFGLITAFNIFTLNKLKSIIFFMVTSWMAAISGFLFLRIMRTDIITQGAFILADVQQSLTLVIVSIIIYLAGSILIPMLAWHKAVS